MPTSIGVADPKPVKGGRKLKKVEHCIIPKTLNKHVKEKSFWSRIENSNGKEKAIEEKMQKNAPNQVRGCF